MTIHQQLYELDKANMQELYLFWIIAALMIVLPAVVVWIWSKKGDKK